MEKLRVRFIRLSDVQEVVPYSASHIWRLEQAGKFPKRVRIGANRVAWVADEIQNWIIQRVHSRDQ